MQPTQKIPIVLATLLFILAAIAEIATGRSRITGDDAEERGRRAALVIVDDALARDDSVTALRAWQRAYEAARMGRGWRGLVEVGDARVRIGTVTNTPVAPRARQLYLAARNRARAERSVEGVVRAAEGFSALGDREVAEVALRMAASLARHSADTAAPTQVETARGRLLDGPRGVTRATF